MAIVFGNGLGSVAGSSRRQKRRKRRPGPDDSCCNGGAPPCPACAAGAGVLEDIGELGAMPGRRGHALRKLGRAHQAGELSPRLGDLDVSAFSIFSLDRSALDAESDAFDGRLNAWLLDYATSAAQLPPAFVMQVDDFVMRWRKIRAGFYFIGANLRTDIVNAEAEFNRLRDQWLGYGHDTSIAPATVTADGKTVRADQIPPGRGWLDQVGTVAKWGGVIVGSVALIKISSDLGLFRRLGKAMGAAP